MCSICTSNQFSNLQCLALSMHLAQPHLPTRKHRPRMRTAAHLASRTQPPPSRTRMCKFRAPCSCRGHRKGSTLRHRVCGCSVTKRGGRRKCAWHVSNASFILPAPPSLKLQRSTPACWLHKTCTPATPVMHGCCHPPGELHVGPCQPEAHVQVPGAVQLPWSQEGEHTAAQGVVQKGVRVQCVEGRAIHMCWHCMAHRAVAW